MLGISNIRHEIEGGGVTVMVFPDWNSPVHIAYELPNIFPTSRPLTVLTEMYYLY